MNFPKFKPAICLFNLAAVLVFAFLLIYGFRSKESMTDLFVHTSYYLTLVLLLIWLIESALLLRHLDFSIKEFLKKYWLGIAIAFILTTGIFASVKVGFKTLSDETNLLAVSRSMLDDKTVYNTTMASRYYGNLNPINNEIPKRTLVFPFLVHLIHGVTGFRYQNVFALNFIIMFLFLSGVYVATRKFLGGASSVAAMLFVASYPVFSIFGTSGGFDLLNSAFFFLVIVAVYYFIKDPTTVAFSFCVAAGFFKYTVRINYLPALTATAAGRQDKKGTFMGVFLSVFYYAADKLTALLAVPAEKIFLSTR